MSEPLTLKAIPAFNDIESNESVAVHSRSELTETACMHANNEAGTSLSFTDLLKDNTSKLVNGGLSYNTDPTIPTINEYISSAAIAGSGAAVNRRMGSK